MQTKLEEIDSKYNIEEFLLNKKAQFSQRKSIFLHRLDSITSLKNLVEEWDIRKFSLPKMDKDFKPELDSNSQLSLLPKNETSNLFSYQAFEEENLIKSEIEKKMVTILPAKFVF